MTSPARSKLLSFGAKGGVCLVLAILILPTVLSADAPPAGWRHAGGVEIRQAWRKKSPTRFLVVKADFEGDGGVDLAELLVNPTTKKFALFVKLATTEKWQMLGGPLALGDLDRFGIDLVKPGKYETACGKTYDDSFCAHGEPDYLTLTHPAIDLIYTESSDVIFYWNRKSKTFQQIQMSD
jgi:hypothetical protein